jgi:carbamoyl-phosphate synthase small subunit
MIGVMMKNNKKLVLQDGSVFEGVGFGFDEFIISELVFNTSMVGYPEILSDNSYCGQMICFTYPMIGNYGINLADLEGHIPSVDALIVRELCELPSNHSMEESLDEFLLRFKIPGIMGVDTRLLTRQIRDNGTQFACICDINDDVDVVIDKLNKHVPRTDEVAQVSLNRIQHFNNDGHKVVVIDCGVKLNIVDELIIRKLDVTVVPHDITYDEIKQLNPVGVVLSNGPGDPKSNGALIELTKRLQDEFVMFGICLGHQIISLANGCDIQKLKFGHRGANHPVKNLLTDKVEITSQNHSYAVIEDTINKEVLNITHVNLLDGSVEGLMLKDKPVFCVQYHPESAPGPTDSNYLFDQFVLELDKKVRS